MWLAVSLVALILLVTAVVVVVNCALKSGDAGPPPSVEFLASPHLASFTLRDKHESRDSTRYTFADGDKVLKLTVIRNVAEDAAPVLLDDGIMGLEAVYANALSPYPGDISREIVHGERFRPKLVKGTRDGSGYAYFILFANARFGYEASADEMVKYKSLVGWLYNAKAQRFYKLQYFVAPETADEELETFFLSFDAAGAR